MHDAQPRRWVRGGAAFAWLLAGSIAFAPPVTASGDLAWQPIGKARGIEAFSAQTSSGIVRIGFRNTSQRPVVVDIEQTLIWCGSDVQGEGKRVVTQIDAFLLPPGDIRTNEVWDGVCDAGRYFVEFRGITIRQQE